MDIITIDFETYYDKQFSLKKLTTEEYIRSPEFEIIGVAVKVNNGQTEWASGTKEQIKAWLQTFNWAESMVLAHNTTFDGAILSWLMGVSPRYWADTLCMARALHGVEVGGSLKALTERYGIGEKGTEVLKAEGKHRLDFTEAELDAYGDYCVNDVELTYKLFSIMGKNFPKKEFRIIDLTLRMFIDPVLELDLSLLQQHRDDIRNIKEKLLADCGISREDLMSSNKFAEVLKTLGVEPPMKESPTTGKQTYAFSKTDEAFKALESHDDPRVQTLVAARLGTKSTLEETRTERFIGIANRGRLPVPIKYYAAHTGRFGGEDKINLQNLPSRGQNANKLKKAITAPFGYSLIDADSAQIEARVLAWLAGQNDLVEAFAKGEDVYKKMASAIYNKPESEIDKTERFVGKTTILGAGYGMGAIKFQAQLKNFGVDVPIEESRRIIDIYRSTNDRIARLWGEAQSFLVSVSRGDGAVLGRAGVLEVVPEQRAIRLPSGLLMRYDGLSFVQGEKGVEFSYKSRYGLNRIYGGKVIENVCQAIARCIIAEQMLLISKKYRVVLTVHDAIMCVVKDEEVQEATAYIEECMKWTPDWASGLPVSCESGSGKSYGDC